MQSKTIREITETLERNIQGIRYGTVSAVIRIHDGRAVKVDYEFTNKIVTDIKDNHKGGDYGTEHGND